MQKKYLLGEADHRVSVKDISWALEKHIIERGHGVRPGRGLHFIVIPKMEGEGNK
jgi:hypothetical protein